MRTTHLNMKEMIKKMKAMVGAVATVESYAKVYAYCRSYRRINLKSTAFLISQTAAGNKLHDDMVEAELAELKLK